MSFDIRVMWHVQFSMTSKGILVAVGGRYGGEDSRFPTVAVPSWKRVVMSMDRACLTDAGASPRFHPNLLPRGTWVRS